MVHPFQADIFNAYRQPGVDCGDAGDAAAHQAAAEDTNTLNGAGFRFTAPLLFHSRSREKDPAQRNRFWRHRQLTKSACFSLMSGPTALLQPDAHHLNNAFCCRIVTLRFGCGLSGRQRKQRLTANRTMQQTIAQRQHTSTHLALFHPGNGGLQQNRLRHRVIDHAQLTGLFRPQGFAGKNQWQCLLHAD